MVSVDDLVISLRIDEGSNLGKLQKQLTALVGPKGEKAAQLGAGISADLKRDITVIKSRLEYITHIAPGIDMEKLALSASALYTTLKDPTAIKNLIGKLDVTDEWLRDIQEILVGISTGTTEMKGGKVNKLVVLLEKAIRQSPATIGDVKQLVTDITEAIEEFVRQKQLQEIFKDFGDSVRHFQIAMGKPPEEVRDILAKDKGLREFVEAQKEIVGTEKIAELVDMIKELKDPIRVLEEFKDINILEFTQLPEKLKPLAAAYIEVMRTEQIQVIDLMREYFQKIKKGSIGITQTLESSELDFLMTIETWEAILETFKGKGLKLLGGADPSEFARYVIVELEKGVTAGYTREMRERLRKFAYTVMVFLKTNQNLDKHIDSLDRTAQETGNTFAAWELEMAKMRTEAGKAMSPEEMEDLMNKQKEKEMDEFEPVKEQTSKNLDEVQTALEDLIEQGADSEIDEMALWRENQKRQEEEKKSSEKAAKVLEEIKKNTENIDRKIEEGNKDPERVEEDK